MTKSIGTGTVRIIIMDTLKLRIYLPVQIITKNEQIRSLKDWQNDAGKT